MTSELVFVFLGPKLPSYARQSLKLATRNSGLDVTIIGESRIRHSVPRRSVRFVELESFYERSEFEGARQNILLDHSFRRGFWVHTLERFFVLEQFARHEKRSSILHAELDQLLFGVNNLAERLDRQSVSGVFFPFHNQEKAVASIFFCNDPVAFRSLLDKASTGPPFGNEMELLVHWAAESPHHVIRLPTLGDMVGAIPQDKVPPLIDAEGCGGIVDAAELGLWVGGRDPRNLDLNERPQNGFTYPPGKAVLPRDLLEMIRFELESSPTRLWVSFAGNASRFRLYNLHLHSKIHPWIGRSGRNLQTLLDATNNGASIALPSARYRQITYVVSKNALRRFRRLAQLAKRWSAIGASQTRRLDVVMRRIRKNLAGFAIDRGHLRLAQLVSPRIAEKALKNALSSYNFSVAAMPLRGKKVIVVGPAPGELNDDDFSDFDVVARIGFTGANSGPYRTSPRCDISFLAKWHANALAERLQSGGTAPARTKFILRNDVDDEVRHVLSEKLGRVSGLDTEPCDKLFSKVIPNFAPQVILWLLAQSPAELRISNLDLMTSTVRPAGYATNKAVVTAGVGWTHPPATMRRSFSQFHNPFTHYWFFSQLQRIHAVSFSPSLRQVIEQGPSAYRRRLQVLYFAN